MAKIHKVVTSREDVKKISLYYYGTDANYYNIVQTNSTLKERVLSGKTTLEGLPILYPGDVLLIPGETKDAVNILDEEPPRNTITKNKLLEKEVEKNALTLVIDSKQYTFFTDYTIKSSIDSFDIVELTSPYFDTDEYRSRFRPFSYKDVNVYYGNDLFMVGTLLAPQASIEPDSEVLTISIYPKCGVLNDCNMPISAYPIEFNGLNLKQIAENIASIFSIGVEFDGNPGYPFEKVAIEPSDTPLQFLIGLAKERGFLITNNTYGDLKIWKADKGSKAIDFISAGKTPFVSCSPKFDPQIFFSEVTGLTGETEISSSEIYTWKNPFLTGVFRPKVIELDDSEEIDLEQTVQSYAGRMFAQAGTYELKLNSHRNRKDEYWKANTCISVFSEKSNIYTKTKFIIPSVILSRSADEGDTATLSLVLPGAYSGELPTTVPWEPPGHRPIGTFDPETGLPEGGI